MKENIFTFIWLFLAASAGIVLYNTSEKTYHTHKVIKQTQAKIEKEQHNIAVLSAEWWHLTTPARLEKLSKKHLPHLQPVTGQQIIPHKKQTPQRIPAQAKVTVPEIEPVQTSLPERTRTKTLQKHIKPRRKPQYTTAHTKTAPKKAPSATQKQNQRADDISDLIENLLGDDSQAATGQNHTSAQQVKRHVQ